MKRAGPRRVPSHLLALCALLFAVAGSLGSVRPALGLKTAAGEKHAQDGTVEWAGLRHDSRDLLYRTPGGAVPAGSPVTLRFRTFHDDVTLVKARVYSLAGGGQQVYALSLAASDVSCYEAGLAGESCDFWAFTLPNAGPDNLWYRFIVADGADTAYYADDGGALDGGLGAPRADAADYSWALTVYDPAFAAPPWARRAIIYQVFPDRFYDGDAGNNPQPGEMRYEDPVVAAPWGALPEGYCRNYADAGGSCRARFDTPPPGESPATEAPRGRDYFGGDLRGLEDKLDYLTALGVTAIYLNPIFWAKSNHRYDTADYLQIDPALGTFGDFQSLAAAARQRGIRLILDGVFDYMSADSPVFDRYHHYAALGACESSAAQYRAWFDFRRPAGGEPAPCAPATLGGGDTYYAGWSGLDSIPVLNKDRAAVQEYFVTGANSVTRFWLRRGVTGWRLDAMGDASFPNGYWETFRQVTKQTDPEALIVGELWQKDSALLRSLRGDRADTAMNYRLRDAVIGFLAPGPFDAQGFAESGQILNPSQFAARLQSVREDYPDAAYYSLMNLLDSHDTERVLWALTPGAETRLEKENTAANVAAGKQRLRLASLIQFSMPGAPAVYYGDEVGMTGDGDPDNRRTYPWASTGAPDQALLDHYRALAQLRRTLPSVVDGDFRVLLADDAAGTVAYGRKTTAEASIVAVNRSGQPRALNIPVTGYLPDGTRLAGKFGGTAGGVVSSGVLAVSLDPMGGALVSTGPSDLAPPARPDGLAVVEGDAQVTLTWAAVAGAAGYNVYRSPLSGGGWVKANSAPLPEASFADSGLRNAETHYYAVTALDAAGNESGRSDEVSAVPHLAIGWADLQWPLSMEHTLNAAGRTPDCYGQVWIDGVTGRPGPTPGLLAQLGFGPAGSLPGGNPDWSWQDAAFNADAGFNDEFVASLQPETAGVFDYLYRYSTTNGRDWLYSDLTHPLSPGETAPSPGRLTVLPGVDTTPPASPSGLRTVSASPAGIELDWDGAADDSTLYGYEVLRGAASGGPYALAARLTGTSFTDADVAAETTYFYVLRAVDAAFNRSPNSAEVRATTTLRTVSVRFTVTVPGGTGGAGRAVHIGGTIDRLHGGRPAWNPGLTAMTRVDATHWSAMLTGKESTEIEYRYALGDWEHVETDRNCAPAPNRILSLSYGSDGTQTVEDSVLNWRNLGPCGN